LEVFRYKNKIYSDYDDKNKYWVRKVDDGHTEDRPGNVYPLGATIIGEGFQRWRRYSAKDK
jgi:hypothetical protein